MVEVVLYICDFSEKIKRIQFNVMPKKLALLKI